MVVATRGAGEKTETERRFYISSLAGDDTVEIGNAVRTNSGIENELHWVLDVAFRKDEGRVREDNAPQSLAMRRHVAVNLLRKEKIAKLAVKNERLRAGRDESYLWKVLWISGAIALGTGRDGTVALPQLGLCHGQPRDLATYQNAATTPMTTATEISTTPSARLVLAPTVRSARGRQNTAASSG